MKIIFGGEKKKILNQLNNQFGIKEIPYLLIRFGKEKIRLYSGNLSTGELRILGKNLRIETVGVYFAKEEKDGIRLTLDGLQLIKNQITKNILEISDEQADNWMRGNDLEIRSDKNYKVLKNNHEFLGCGKSTGDKITNFVPKERRVK